MPKRIAAVIPAYNEEKTIGKVIALLQENPAVAEVIVVDDGSSDATASVARASGARVIVHGRNSGKARALATGVAATSADTLFFIDADMTGLTSVMLESILRPVISGECDMFVALVERKPLANWLIHVLPLLGGTRVLSRALWEAVPDTYRHGFQIEVALNYFVRKNGGKISYAVVPGLGHVIKERKRGLWWGLYQRFFMIADIVGIILRLSLRSVLEKLF